MKNNLENELFESVKCLDDLGGDFSLEDSLFIVSGIDSAGELEKYKDKLSYLHLKYGERLNKKDPESKARTLIKFLGNGQKRYRGGESFSNNRLDKNINRKIGGYKVGNCVGLSSLGGVLGLREDLNLGCLSFPDHISLFLKNGSKKIPMETTDKGGFNMKYEKNDLNYLKEERIEFLLPALLGNRGICNDKIKDLAKAIELFEDSSFYFSRALFLEDRGKMKEARVDYEKAVMLENIPFLNYSFRYRLFNKREYKKAIEQFNQCINQDPKNAAGYLHRGLARFRLGEYERALKDFTKAKNFGRDEYKKGAHFEMGRVYEKMGEYGKALKEFEKYSNYNMENKREVKKRVERIKRIILLHN